MTLLPMCACRHHCSALAWTFRFLHFSYWLHLNNSAVQLPVQWRSNKLKHVGSAGAQVSGWREYQTISPQ